MNINWTGKKIKFINNNVENWFLFQKKKDVELQFGIFLIHKPLTMQNNNKMMFYSFFLLLSILLKIHDPDVDVMSITIFPQNLLTYANRIGHLKNIIYFKCIKWMDGKKIKYISLFNDLILMWNILCDMTAWLSWCRPFFIS